MFMTLFSLILFMEVLMELYEYLFNKISRLPQHSALNNIIKRALSSAGFNEVLEPVGLERGDGKRLMA